MVGITYLNSGGEPVRKQQVHGEIVAANPAEGIVIRRGDQSTLNMPPDLDRLEPAAPGTYTLKETGEMVVDPDFVCFVRFTPPVS
jgi:hypothetical protein